MIDIQVSQVIQKKVLKEEVEALRRVAAVPLKMILNLISLKTKVVIMAKHILKNTLNFQI